MTQGLNKFRRQLLIALGSMPLAGWLITTRGATDQDYNFASALTNMLQDQYSSKYIGKLYLETAPDEANIKQLLNCIRHEHPELEVHAQGSHTALNKRIKTLQSEDFDKERVISLDGWVLSRTEARLCALTTFV